MAERRDTRQRFEQWAKNPECQANVVSAVHGISMADVAESEGATPTMGQSPFAIARGHNFERALFKDDAALLREELIGAGVLPPDSIGFRDLRIRRNGGPLENLDAALQATAVLLRDIARGRRGDGQPALPTIVAGATVRVPGGVMLPEAILVLDVLAVLYAGSHPTLVVGEIKTYPDRGGHTDAGELATARAQAGIYVHGLRLVLEELGLDRDLTVSARGFLVLTRPGSNRPSVRADEDLHYQAERAERGFAQLRKVAATLPPLEGDARLAAVREAPVAYREVCVTFCDRAPICHTRALSAGDPAALGEDVTRFLGETRLDRALALIDGAEPLTAAEKDLVRRLTATYITEARQ